MTSIDRLAQKNPGVYGFIVNTEKYPAGGVHWVMVVCDVGPLTKIARIYDPLPHTTLSAPLSSLLKTAGIEVRRHTAMNWQNDNWRCGYYCFYAFGALRESLALKSAFEMPDGFEHILQFVLKSKSVPEVWQGKVFSEKPRKLWSLLSTK